MQTKEQILKNIWDAGYSAGRLDMQRDLTDRVSNYEYENAITEWDQYKETALEAMELYASQRQGGWVKTEKRIPTKPYNYFVRVWSNQHNYTYNDTNYFDNGWSKLANPADFVVEWYDQFDKTLREFEASPTSQPAQGEEQPARKKGVHTFGGLIKNAMKENLVSTVPGISTETLNDLLNDNYYPNSVPIYTLRNMLRLLNIPIENAVPAIYHTFELLQMQKEESRKGKRFYEINWKEDLWKCDEALDKYINRLIELMPVSTHFFEPVAAQGVEEAAKAAADLLFNFSKFLGSNGYKINGYDDAQLLVTIKRFLDEQGKYAGASFIQSQHPPPVKQAMEFAPPSDFTLWVVVNKWQYDYKVHKWWNDYIGEVKGVVVTHDELYELFIQSKNK